MLNSKKNKYGNYCTRLWKLFKDRNFSKEETIRRNTVIACHFFKKILGFNSLFDEYIMMAFLINFPKKVMDFIFLIAALASKKWLNHKIKTLYHVR